MTSHKPPFSPRPISSPVKREKLGGVRTDNHQTAKRSLFSISAKISHQNKERLYDIIPYLQSLDFPETTIRSMLKCGVINGREVIKLDKKKGETTLFDLRYKCNSRICFYCVKKRQRRFRSVYLDYLEDLPQNKTISLRHLTISPENYDPFYSITKKKKGEIITLLGVEAAFHHISISFAKFRRLEDINDKIIGGLYVLESKKVYEGQPYYDKKDNFLGLHTKTGWNVHIHTIIYGKRLDNQIRGHCLDCNQNLMHYDNKNKEYYCASKKCQSRNVKVENVDSKLVTQLKASFGRDVNVHITKLPNASHTLNYMLKYISSSKEDFLSPADLAQFTKAIQRKKLVHPFGSFFTNGPDRSKIKQDPDIEYITDPEVIEEYKKKKDERESPAYWEPQSEFIWSNDNDV